MISLTAYFPMYAHNTYIMRGWQKEQFRQQKMWTLAILILRYSSRFQATSYYTNRSIQFTMPTKLKIVQQSFWAHWIYQVCHHTFYDRELDLRLFYYGIWTDYKCAMEHDSVIKTCMKNIIEVIIFNSKFWVKNCLLPWIPMILTDELIEFKRVKFPKFLTRLAFAMKNNKSNVQKMFAIV